MIDVRAGIVSLLRVAIPVLLSVTSPSVAGCSTQHKGQLLVDEHPFVFVDGANGDAIDRVLVVPTYRDARGVSTGVGHGPGYMNTSSFVAFPFVYRSGEPFRPRQIDSKGLLIPGQVFAGEGVTLKGVMVIAMGYRSTWIWQMWERPRDPHVPLRRLDGQDALRQRETTAHMFDGDQLRPEQLPLEEREALGLSTDAAIQIRFGNDERRLVKDFLER